MAFQYFQIPAADGESVQAELNAFLAGKKVIRLEQHFVAEGASSFWAVSVQYSAGSGPSGNAAKRSAPFKNQVDYREILSPEDFTIYDRLRRLRKQLAKDEGLEVSAGWADWDGRPKGRNGAESRFADLEMRRFFRLEALFGAV
tara:strand:- start:604 stop:1035 length:432 start_codon:yes stop_codon:yes gene_type:complete